MSFFRNILDIPVAVSLLIRGINKNMDMHRAIKCMENPRGRNIKTHMGIHFFVI